MNTPDRLMELAHRTQIVSDALFSTNALRARELSAIASELRSLASCPASAEREESAVAASPVEPVAPSLTIGQPAPAVQEPREPDCDPICKSVAGGT
jgi:hypothetical protein